MGAPFAARLARARQQFDAGNFGAAEPDLRSIFASQKDCVEAAVLLGVIAAKTNRASEAEHWLSEALSLDAGRYDALSWLAAVKRSQGDLKGAVELLNRARALRADDPETVNLLGLCHLSLGEANRAVACFSEAVRMQPGAAQGHFNLGMAYRMLNLRDEAVECFLRAVQLAPEHPQNYLQAFKSLQQVSRWDEAVQYLEKGLVRHPKASVLIEALASAYGRLNQPEKAEALFQRVGPDGATTYAIWLQEEGRFEDSVEVLRQSLALQPVQGAAYRLLAEARCFDLTDAALKVFQRPDVDDRSRMHLAYAIAKSFDNSGDYQEAMRYFEIANDLAYRVYPASRTFDTEAAAIDASIMSGVYTADVLERMRGLGSPSSKPIFIVGMVRSGTTLLDQIISSHPQVVSAGEQPYWNAEADRIHRKWREQPDAFDLAPLAEGYFAALEAEVGDSPRITDKMPLNFRHLGLIHAALPQAKILHIRRNPIDTCLSIYMTFFAGGPNFTYNKANIVAFYRSYLEMMEHWRSVLPASSFLELDYESLVANPPELSRQVIEFLDLPWDDACLRHEGRRSTVPTPSRWQARQPIYGTSIERWRRYEPWLGEFLSLEREPG